MGSTKHLNCFKSSVSFNRFQSDSVFALHVSNIFACGLNREGRKEYIRAGISPTLLEYATKNEVHALELSIHSTLDKLIPELGTRLTLPLKILELSPDYLTIRSVTNLYEEGVFNFVSKHELTDYYGWAEAQDRLYARISSYEKVISL